MKRMIIPARTGELDKVVSFIEKELEANGCTMHIRLQLVVAAEEIFVNIAHYAYKAAPGEAEIQVSFEGQPKSVVISFIDSGIPYNPLRKADPDITLDAGTRKIGGLGIYMVKKSMDQVLYEYKEGKNHLTLIKQIE
jgi:anti-sigma regulatory factor (Ser/Thr protein kinase)